MIKAFALQADHSERKTTFAKLGEGLYCLSAEGDRNSRVIVGDDGVMVVDAAYEAMTPAYGKRVNFEHRQPFNISHCYDEMSEFGDPRIWIAERGIEMWKTLQI